MQVTTEQPIYSPKEDKFLGLLKELQPILDNAISSLAGKPSPTTSESSYLARLAVSVNRAAEGYLWLRESGRVDASKLLIRPALEAIFSGTAAIKKREFLFRKAYSEWEEDKKIFAKDATGETEANQSLEELKRAFKQYCPDYPIKCKPVRVRETAEMAELFSVYDGAYRIYCQFTHCALSAVMGGLDETTDPKDTHQVVWCVLMMLDQLQKHTPAQIPELSQFKKELALLKGPKESA